MKLTLESTPSMFKLTTGDGSTLVRLWRGKTETGLPIVAYIATVVAAVRKDHANVDELCKQLDEELIELTGDDEPTIELIAAMT